jgi:hypothetical protein
MINENFDNDKYWKCNIVNTMSPINTEIPDKEYIVQHVKKYGYRCISHHPHYIMTDWVKNKEQALIDGDNAIERFYTKMARAGEALHTVYERMIKESGNNPNDKL